MIKTIIASSFVALIFLSSAGLASAAVDEKPWAGLSQFRGGASESAQAMEMDRSDFMVWRDEMREAHLKSRLEARQQRLEDAVDRGCLAPESMKERLTQRLYRFR